MTSASAKSNPSTASESSTCAGNGGGDAGKPLDAPFRIARDGAWFYRGSRIDRPEMVRLFARALRRENPGDPGSGYALVTPYERHAVAVEDSPFVAVAMRRDGDGRSQRLILTTNIGAEVVAGPGHPIVVRAEANGDPRPYIVLDDGLEARLSRAVYYDLAVAAEDGPTAAGDTAPGVWSDGAFFPLDVPRESQ
jgi:uncharacterized protein